MSAARVAQTDRGELAWTVKHAGHRVAVSANVRRRPGQFAGVCLHLAYTTARRMKRPPKGEPSVVRQRVPAKHDGLRLGFRH